MIRIAALLLGVVVIFLVVHWIFDLDFYAAATYGFGKLGNFSLIETLIALEQILLRWALASAPTRVFVVLTIIYLGLREFRREWHFRLKRWYDRHHHWRVLKAWRWFVSLCERYGIGLRLVFVILVVLMVMWLVLWGASIYLFAIIFPRSTITFGRFLWRYTIGWGIELLPSVGLTTFSLKVWERAKQMKVAQAFVKAEKLLEEKIAAPIESAGDRHREYLRTHPRVGELMERYIRIFGKRISYVPKPESRQHPPKAVFKEEEEPVKKKTHTARLLAHHSHRHHKQKVRRARDMNLHVRRHHPNQRR